MRVISELNVDREISKKIICGKACGNVCAIRCEIARILKKLRDILNEKLK
jgi:hypothetical protein